MKLIHFTAAWCGPCKMMKPVVAAVVSEKNLTYFPIDIDENPETASDYGIMSVPTFVLEDDEGNAVTRVTGAMPKQAFLDALDI